jgi:hypothetical protein
MTPLKLEVIRWVTFAVCIACWGFGLYFYASGGFGILLFFGGLVLGIPSAMLSLHLHPPKWLRLREQPKR